MIFQKQNIHHKIDFILTSQGSSRFALSSKLLALCFLLFIFIFPLDAQEKENAEFKLAVGLYNDGMYDLAVEQFKNLINAYPNTSNGIEARFYLGETQMKLKRYDEARITFQNFALAYVEHPKASEAWMNVGDAFLALGNKQEAASAYERVKVFHPKSQLVPEALLKAAQLFNQIGDRESAKKNYRIIIQEYPTSTSVLTARLAIGGMYADEGQTELAEREARRVAESDAPSPVKASALFSIGKLQLLASLFDEAEATFKSVIANFKKTSASVAATFELGKLEMGLHNYDAAIDYFKTVLSNDDANDSLKAMSYFETGLSYSSQKEYDKAQKSFDKLLTKYPTYSLNQQGAIEAGKAAYLNRDSKLALQYANRLIAQDTGNNKATGLLLAANASIALKQYNDAGRYYSTFVDGFAELSSTPMVMLNLAYMYQNILQDFRKALTVFDQITEKYPQYSKIVDVTMGVAKCQEQLNDFEGAVRTYTEIQSRYPANDKHDSIQNKIEFLQHHKIKNREGGIEKLAQLMGEVLTEKSKTKLSLKLGAIYFNDLKDYESASKQFSNAIDGHVSGDDLIDASYYRARACHLQSEINPDLTIKAIDGYDSFLKQFPESRWSEDVGYFDYSLKSRNKNPTEIISLAREFLSKYPTDRKSDKIYFDLAIASNEAGAPFDALQWFDLITKEFPESHLIPSTLLEQGKIYLSLNQPDSAAIVWQKVISHPMKNSSTKNAIWILIELQRRNNNYSEAIGLMKKLINEYYYSSYAEKTKLILPEVLIANKEYNEAIQIYTQMMEDLQTLPVEKDVDNNLFFHLANVYEKKGERQKAIQYYNRYLLKDRKGAHASKAFYSLGALARAQGKMNDASAYFKQAAALGEIGSTTKEIAELLFHTEQYAEAAVQYAKLAQSTDSVDLKSFYRSRMIIATFRLDKITEAQKLATEFEQSYKDEKKYRAVFEYERSLAYYRKQDYNNAKKSFEEVADDYEETQFGSWAEYYLGKISEATNKLEDAAKRYESILKNSPDSDVIPRVLLSLGNMHFNVERFEESIRYYQQIIKLPERAGDILLYAMNNLIEAYESTKLNDEALKMTRDYIERYPNDDNIIDKKIKLGTLYTKIGYYDQAVLHFQNLIPEAGSLLEAEIRYNIGEAYYYKGEYQQAILEFLKVPYLVTKQGKVNWTATSLYMAGQSYEKMSKFDEAITMYQQIIDRPGIDTTFKAAARKEIDRVKSISKNNPK